MQQGIAAFLADKFFRQIPQSFSKLLFPPKCLDCGIYFSDRKIDPLKIEAHFCPDCLGKGLVRFDTPYCTFCGKLFEQKSIPSHVCESCLKKPLRLKKVRAALEYDGVMKKALPMFKYQGRLSLAPLFEHLMAACFSRHFSGECVDLILPVPLHYKRVRERGFNQAYILVRNLGKILEREYGKNVTPRIDIESVARIKRTAPQTGFDMKQRKKNLKNAFKVVSKGAIKNKSILLVDDVFTTGTTCNELAGELLKNGAQDVNAMVLARA